ncbi:MAG TPA: TIGR03618 family F420-dependent PPOX class oxidoreductase [Euzebyales bacterium]
METIDGPDLHAEVRTLASGRNFAAVATLLPDGQPQNQLTWIDTDGTHLLVNTPASTQKRRNVARDARITIAVWNRDNPFQYAEVRGDVVDTIDGEQAWQHINTVARRHGGDGYGMPRHDRVVLVIRPRRQLLARPPRL